MINYGNIKRFFALALVVAAMLACSNATMAAVTITGEVTPNVQATPYQPTVDLYVGSASGFGELDIDDATVTVNGANIGYGTNDGTVLLGAFSGNGELTTMSNAIIGQGGLGYLELNNSSTMTVNGWMWLNGSYAGNAVDLTSSTLNVTDTQFGLYIGGGAEVVTFTSSNSDLNLGCLNIMDNSQASFTGTSAINITGDFNISGSSSNVYLQQSVDLSVGGDMNVTNATVQVVGSALNPTAIEIGGTLNVDTASSGSFSVTNDAVVTAEAMTVTGGSTIVVNDGTTGSIVVGSHAPVAGAVYISSDGTFTTTGSIDIQGSLITEGTQGEIGGEGYTPQTYTVDNYELLSGATLIVNVDSDTMTSDVVDVTAPGTATLYNGGTILVNPLGSSQTSLIGTPITIISSPGGITDNLDPVTGVQSNSMFLTFTGAVDGTGTLYQVTAAQGNSFASQAVGKNNVSTANALDIMLNSGTATAGQTTMLNNLLTFSNAAAFNNAMHQMNAEMYTLHGRNLPNQMESFHRFLSQHLTQMRNGNRAQLTAHADSSLGMALASTEVDPETMAEIIESKQEQDSREDALTNSDSVSNTGWSVWGQIINMWHKEKSSSRLTGYNNYSWGAVVGTDREFAPGLRIGALIGYIRSEYHMKDYRGKLDVDTLRVGPYVDWSMNRLFVEAALTFGYHWNDAERRVNYPGFSDTDKADNYGAWDLSPYARVGYRFTVAGWDVTPSVALQYVHYDQRGVKEHGGAAALKVDGYEVNSLRQIVMLEVTKLFDLNYLKLVPAFSVGYSYDYLNTGETLDSSFIGGYPMTFYPGGTSKGHVIWGASVTALLSDSLSVFIRYDGFAAGSDYSNSLSSGVNYKF